MTELALLIGTAPEEEAKRLVEYEAALEDARWTKEDEEVHCGYKNHIMSDARRWESRCCCAR